MRHLPTDKPSNGFAPGSAKELGFEIILIVNVSEYLADEAQGISGGEHIHPRLRRASQIICWGQGPISSQRLKGTQKTKQH